MKGRICDLSLEDRELSSKNDVEKNCRLDIRATTDQGQILDIECSTYKEGPLGARELFYFSKLYSSQPASGHEYNNLKPVIVINLLSFNYFEREDYHSRYALREDVYHDSLTDKISIHFIEARKCHRLSEKNQSRLMRWMDYLSDNTPVALMQLDGKDEIFESVREAEKMFVRDREAMLRYEARERYEMDMASLKGESRREGRAEERIEIAHNMLKNGFSLEQIKLATRLTDDEMAALS